MDRESENSGRARVRRWAVDLAILITIGLLMGFLGPFGWAAVPAGPRYLYWMICMVGGGVIAVAADGGLRRWVGRARMRVLVVSVLMTPPVTLLVLLTHRLVVGGPFSGSGYGMLLVEVFPVLLAVMAVRSLVWHRPPVRVETRTVIAPPLPEAEATFRRRLSAKRRTARLIAIEAHDHYLRVHTDAGVELIALRFADALKELSHAHGWRVHRSWWVAADAIETVRWRRGAGEVRLVGGLKVPTSRTHGPVLKQAGWF